jgi:aryl-alcohol dehydrogenase-like predicted oxidoreductase
VPDELGLDPGLGPTTEGQDATPALVPRGAAISEVPDEEADGAISLALEAGVDRCDTAAGYGDPELHYGRWMPRIRDRKFLSTKTDPRVKGATRSKPPSNALRLTTRT